LLPHDWLTSQREASASERSGRKEELRPRGPALNIQRDGKKEDAFASRAAQLRVLGKKCK